jgi:predicted RNase H-like HicB family nuclease
MFKNKLKYLIVIEKANHNYSAYLPDITGYIATGKTIEEVKKNITEALAMHLHGLGEDGLSSPEPKAKADYDAV